MENNEEKFCFDKVEEAIEIIKNGGMVIVADDESRENEGDLICSAEKATPEMINFMMSKAKGIVCVPITEEKAVKLGLDNMVKNNTDTKGTAFTQSIDADPKYGVTTGVSAYDRAKTVNLIASDEVTASDFRQPGHIFPLIAKKGGVLKRVGHTEASVDLCKLAGLKEVAVICEIVNEDGTMARRDELRKFADEYGIKFITVAQIIAYRLRHERFVQRMAKAMLPTPFGVFDIYAYLNTLDGTEYVALVKGLEDKTKTPVVRMHSECLTGDVFHSLKCDCGTQLDSALQYIDENGSGALVYLRNHEGRGIGLVNKIKAYALQEKGCDTVEANIKLGFEPDLRDYGVGAQILLDLGLVEFNLITNNPQKIIGLEGYGIKILDRVALPPYLTKYNERYMKTKQEKMEHVFSEHL